MTSANSCRWNNHGFNWETSFYYKSIVKMQVPLFRCRVPGKVVYWHHCYVSLVWHSWGLNCDLPHLKQTLYHKVMRWFESSVSLIWKPKATLSKQICVLIGLAICCSVKDTYLLSFCYYCVYMLFLVFSFQSVSKKGEKHQNTH